VSCNENVNMSHHYAHGDSGVRSTSETCGSWFTHPGTCRKKNPAFYWGKRR